jgi:dynactin 1
MSGYQVGQTIQLADGKLATVRYVGQTEFAAGEWIGVELEGPTGKNDGSVQGERYFDCEPDKGMFVRETAIVAIVEQPPAPKAAAPAKKAARPSSVVSSGLGRRGSTVPDTVVNKRMSMNAASPSPAARPGSRPSSMLRVSLTATRLILSYLISDSPPQNLLRSNSQQPLQPPRPQELALLPMLEHLL